MARSKELVKAQIQDLQTKRLDSVKQSNPRQQNTAKPSNTNYRKTGKSNAPTANWSTPRSGSCGRRNRQHGDGKCPAIGKQCRKCQKMNHFAVRCRNKDIQEVTGTVGGQEDSFFLGSVTTCTDESEAWFVKLKICKKEPTFKIDTGADTTVITEGTYKTLPWIPTLQR